MRARHLVFALALAACGARDLPGADVDDRDAAAPWDAGFGGAPAPDAGQGAPLAVDLTDPPDGAVLGRDFDVFARPNRVDGVRVRFWLDEVMLGVVDAPPYTVRVRVADFAPGPHVLRAVARDAAGARVEDAVRVTFGRDDGPPSLRFVTPREGEVVTGPTEVIVAAGGDVGAVRLEVDGEDVGRFRDGRLAWTPPYVHTFRGLRAVAEGAEAFVRVEVDHPTRVEMTRCVEIGCAPVADGEQLGGPVEVQVDARDDEPLDVFRLEVYLDERFVHEGDALPHRFGWDVSGWAPGEHHVRVALYLADGREAEGRWRFRVGGGGAFTPGAHVTWLDIPPDPMIAQARGCRVAGHNLGAGAASLVGLFGVPYASAVAPGPGGAIPHLVLAHVANWPDGVRPGELGAIDLRLLDGVHRPPAMWVARSSFFGGDPAQPPRVRYGFTPVDGDGRFTTMPVDVGVGLPPLLGPRPLFLAGATLSGRLRRDGPGFGVGEGVIAGHWTEAELLAVIADFQAACAGDDRPDGCHLLDGLAPPGAHPREILPILVGFVGGYDAIWNGREAAPCEDDHCNAVSVCVLYEMSGAEIAGVAP